MPEARSLRRLSPNCGAPQAAVSAPVEMSQLTAISAPVEMPQPPAVSVLVGTPLPAAVSALVKTSQPIAFAHWLASDPSHPGPQPRPVTRGREGLSEPGPRNAAKSDGLIEPPADDIRPGRNVPVADSEGTRENKLLTDDAVNMSFVGIWAADARACSALDRSGFLLTVHAEANRCVKFGTSNGGPHLAQALLSK
jgi:hypothetical protein